MVRNVPAGAKVVIEPVVSGDWAQDIGRSLPWTPTGERWYRYATWLTDVDDRGNPLPRGTELPITHGLRARAFERPYYVQGCQACNEFAPLNIRCFHTAKFSSFP